MLETLWAMLASFGGMAVAMAAVVGIIKECGI
jgi:hypothetical protein